MASIPRLRPSALVLLALLAGCSGGGTATGTPAAGGALLDLWPGLDDGVASAGQGEVCVQPFGTYFADFGIRGLACAAGQAASPASVVARAPVAPFVSGPHLATDRAVRLDLNAENAFGHYDPAFVRWLTAAAIPEGQTARVLAQPIYDRHLARLARIYWLARLDLGSDGYPASTPVGPLAAYADYLEGGPVPDGMEGHEGGFAVFAFTDRSEGLLPQIDLRIGNEWTAKYEANTAFGFWLRRRADGTQALWRDALGDLLQAFDADWLAAHRR